MNQVQYTKEARPTAASSEPLPTGTRRVSKPRNKPQMTEQRSGFTSIEAGAGLQPAFPPTEEQIRERAYFIYLERGGTGGDPHADWLQAERELVEQTRARQT